MATNDLLQHLPMLGNATPFTDVSESNRRQVETFLSTGNIAIGDWVQLDNNKTGPERVIYVASSGNQANGNSLVCGVALDAATTGIESRVRVVVAGYVEGAKVTALVALGMPLVVDANAPTADLMAAGDIAPACGVTLEAGVGGTCDVWVYKNF